MGKHSAGHQETDEAAVGGPWTRHGHAVPGVTVAGPKPPGMAVARCGGPMLCSRCAKDANALQRKNLSSTIPTTPGATP